MKDTKKYIYTERADLFDPNIYIELMFEIEGNPPIQMVKEAIKQAYCINEVTMSKIVIRGEEAFYESIEECQCSIAVTTQDWKEIIKENEKRPFAIDKGELIRTFIIESNNQIMILIMAHHLAGDGKSIIYFIEDFMNILSGKNLDKKPMLLFSKNTLSKITKLSPIIKLYASTINRQWKKYNKQFTTEDYYALHTTYWETHESVILEKHYNKEELSILYGVAKTNQLSLTNLMIAAFLKASSNYQSVGIAVDGRLSKNKSMSNQASGISIKATYKSKRSILQNATVIQRNVQRKLNNISRKYFILRFMPLLSPSLVDSILFHIYGLYSNPVSKKLADVMSYTYKKDSVLSITNLTRLDIPQQYGVFTIKNIIFIPPVISYAKRVIGIISDDNGMTIVYHFMNELNLEAEKSFFASCNQNLYTIINNG